MTRTAAGDEDRRTMDKNNPLYWEKRKKNNEAAKRSRLRKKTRMLALESHLNGLKKENQELRMELSIIKRRFGLEDDRQRSPIPWTGSTYLPGSGYMETISRVDSSPKYIEEATYSKDYLISSNYYNNRLPKTQESKTFPDYIEPLCLKKEVNHTDQLNTNPNWVASPLSVPSSLSTGSTPSPPLPLTQAVVNYTACRVGIKTEHFHS